VRRSLAFAVFVLFAAAAQAQPSHWVASWFTSQQVAEPENMLPPEVMGDATLRQVVRLSIGGTGFRVLLSNAFGATPLHLSAVHVARPTGPGEIDPATDRALTFSGRPDVTIPAGASYLSDPVALPVAPFEDVAITIRTGEPPAVETSHPGSRATSYVVAGDHVSDARLEGAKTIDHWYLITGIDVTAAPHAKAVVALGDSIIDGRGSTTNGNDRWTDVLAEKLAANPATRGTAVLNAGLGGNRLLNDGKGTNTLARFDRDVLAPSGVAGVIVLEGINDLGTLTSKQPASPEEHAVLVNRIIAAYEQIAARAHTHGLKAMIATIMPFMGNETYHPDAANEADRTAVNSWIRTQKLFDGVIDFDALMRDPAQPDRLNPAYDTGDHLHPGPAGYRAMGALAATALLPAGKAVPRPHGRAHKTTKKHK